MNVNEFLRKKSKEIDEMIEKYLPKQATNEWVEEIFGKPLYSYNTKTLQKAFNEPIWEFLERGGKRWRPALFLLFLDALGGNVEKFKSFSIVLELLHNGSIIVDDIEDDSEMRRGKPCMHKIYGVDVAINAGNFLYFLAFMPLLKRMEDIESKKFRRLFRAMVEELNRIHAGQGCDIVWHRGILKPESVDEDAYLQMCAYKTGVLPRLAARMAAVLAGKGSDVEEKLGRLAEAMGIAFQIIDDVLNISPSEKWGKALGDDISEGKITLMVIHTLKTAGKEDKKRLMEILRMHTKEKRFIEEAIGIIKRNGGIDYAKKRAKDMVINAWKEAEPMLIDGEAKDVLKNFVNFLVERDV